MIMFSFADQPGGGLGQDPSPAGVRCEFPGMKRPLDSGNHFGVAASGEQFGIMKMPVRWLARDEAINLAAWLMVMADPTGEAFERVVKEIVKA
jgi:hypothetical protein